MEDANIMTSNKYVPKTPGGKDGTGYNNDYKEAISSSSIDTQTVVDYDSENFKYGLGYFSSDVGNVSSASWRTDPMFFFQDPLFASFDIILDTFRSPLFITTSGSTYKNSLSKFLQDYGSISSIGTRQKLHREFLKTLYTLFNTDFNQIERNKSYYVNSIAGLDTLNKRMIDFEKDKITITLNEDVSMISAYLSHLYKNLAYSYRDQRHIIPANLLRFNMYIKISDVRNMYWFKDSGSTMSFDKSYQIFMLRDCTFDFFKSKNFEDSITAAGFEAGKPDKISTLSFDVYFKSVEIESEYPLIMSSFSLGSENSGTLKLNNKDKNIDSQNHNEVFINNSKSVGTFNDQISKNKNRNNDSNNQNNMVSLSNGFKASQGTKEDFDKTVNLNWKNKKSQNGGDRTYDPAVVNSEITSDVNVMTNFDIYSQHSEDLLDVPFLSTDINGEFPSPDNVQFSNVLLLNQLNSEFNINRLFQIPQTILSMFFGGLHGFLPSPNPLRIYPGDSILNDNILKHGRNNFLRIDSILKPTKELDHIVISGDTVTQRNQGLGGNVITSNVIAPNNLDGEIIPFALPPLKGLTDEVIPLSLPKLKSLDGEFIPFALHPADILNVRINNIANPRRFPFLGDLTGNGKPRESIDTIYLTGPASRTFENLGSVYTNKYDQRKIDLGSLYGKVTNDNVLGLLYLYSKTEKFSNLENYKVYSNSNLLMKGLDSIIIDQTSTEKIPFEIIHKYDNNVINQKILDNRVYSNVQNELTMPILSLYDNSQIPKKQIENKFLYNNLIDQKEINLGFISTNTIEKQKMEVMKVYEPSNIQKLLQPNVIFKPNNKKEIDLGNIYKNVENNKNFEEIRIDMNDSKSNKIQEIIIDDKEISNKFFEKMNVNEDNKILQKEIELGFIDQEIREKPTLDEYDKLNNGEDKKEKEGLNNERLR